MRVNVAGKPGANLGALYSIGSSAVTGFAGAVSGVLVARTLGPTDRGLLASLTVVPFLVMTITSLGLDDAISRAIGRRELEPAEATRLVLRWGLAWGMLVGVLVWPVQTYLVLDGRSTLEATLIVFLAPAFVVTRLLNGITLGQGRYLTWNLLRASGGLTYAAMIAGLFVLEALTLLQAVLAWVASYALSVLLSGLATAPKATRKTLSRPKDVLRPLIRFGWRVGTTKVGSQLSQRADQVILAFMVPLQDLGIYAVAATIALSPGVLIIGFSSYVFAVYTRAPIETRRRDGRRLAICGWFLTLTIYTAVGAGATDLLKLGFGNQFVSAAALTKWLCVAAALHYGSLVSVSILNSEDKAGQAARAQTLSLMLTIILMPVAVYRLGMIGATYVLVATNGLNALLVTRSLRKALSVPSLRDEVEAPTELSNEPYQRTTGGNRDPIKP